MKTKASCPIYFIFIALMFLGLSNLVHAQQQQQNTQVVPTPPTTPTPKKQGDDSVGCILEHFLVNLTVTVFNKHGLPVTGLTKNAFTVYDNNEKQDIWFFGNEDAPVSVAVVFNLYGGMGSDKVKRVCEALKKFIENSHHETEYFLIGFNSRAKSLLDRTLDGSAVLNRLKFIETKGATFFYDACYLGIEKVLHGKHKKRALLAIDDGGDSNSRYTFKELNRLLKESDVTIYTIGILGSDDFGSSLGMQGLSYLDELASVTGGKAFSPRSAEEMDDAFYRIATELRQQYSIGYEPSNFTDNGKWHKIKIKVQEQRGLPRLNVRTREGYYATTNPR
jgi:Ca-activated chloride channel homolog